LFLDLADQADEFVTSGMVEEALKLYDEAAKRASRNGSRVDPETGTDWVSFFRGKKALLQIMLESGASLSVTEAGYQVVSRRPQKKQTGELTVF